MPIDLDQSDGTPKNLRTRAFARPGADAVLRWDALLPNASARPMYAPYLVHILELVEHVSVTFLGVDLETAKDIEGQPHVVRLVVPRVGKPIVKSRLPSTLRGYVKGMTPCAILFLSEKYPRIAELARAKGKGMFPIGVSDAELHERLRQFSRRAQGDTKRAFDRAFGEYLEDQS